MWTYPSWKIFYNALVRKGKLDENTKEEDAISVIMIHNCMNEGTWGRIFQCEKVMCLKNDGGDGDRERSHCGSSLEKLMG